MEEYLESENNQEVAVPGTGEEELKTGVNEAEPAPQPSDPPKTGQDAEENAKYAAARRSAQAQLKEFGDRVDAFAKARGFSSFAEMEKQPGGWSKADLSPVVEEVLEEHPEVMLAGELVGKELIEKELQEISALDGSVSTLEDLKHMKGFEAFDDLVRNKGYRLVDAYKVVHFDRLLAQKTAMAKQALLNSINSKSHLQSSGGNAGIDTRTVPADVLEWYRKFNPNATEQQIREHYFHSLEE